MFHLAICAFQQYLVLHITSYILFSIHTTTCFSCPEKRAAKFGTSLCPFSQTAMDIGLLQ
jgi:hypothetical protein